MRVFSAGLPVILILILYSCSNTEYFKTDRGEISTQGIMRIDYYDDRARFDWNDSVTPKHSVFDKTKIKSIIEGINFSNSPAPWKGASWNKICIIKSDTTIVLNTNGKVVGTSSSGQFYQFQDPNFIKTHFE